MLFTKLRWPADSERATRFSSQAATWLPRTAEASHYPFLMLNVKQGSCEYNFYSIWFDPIGNRTRAYCLSNFIQATTICFGIDVFG